MTCLTDGIDVTLDLSKVHRVVNSKFINVAIDTGVVRHHWETFNPKSTRVKTLAAALAPSYLRVGGTEADFLIFKNDKAPSGKNVGIYEKDVEYMWKKQYLTTNLTRSQRDKEIKRRNKRDIGYWTSAEPLTNFTMTASFYDQIHEFVSSVGWDLIFDLNSLLRKPSGAWDSSNAIQLINYTAQSGYKMGGWELGNEPDEYTGVVIKHKLVTPEQLAKDFETLVMLVKSYPTFSGCQIFGPDIAAMSSYVRKGFFYSFLSAGGGDAVTAATFHQYYEDGAVAKIEDFYNPDILNILYNEIQTGVNLTRAAGSSANVWLGETSSAWRGGAPNISDRYVAGFAWLDKLGMSARDGIDALIRQTFYGGHYALLDQETLDPNPDYWLTLLYKLLVGNRVLRVTSPDSSRKLRVYAHCTETVKSGYQRGSVTMYVMNLGDFSTTIKLAQYPAGTELHSYTMSPPGDDITAQTIMLNGVLLQMKDDRTLPDLLIPVKTTDSVFIKPKTYTFIVVPNAQLSVCM